MKDAEQCSESIALLDAQDTHHNNKDVPADSSRRSFIGKVGGATAVALAAGIPLEPLFEGKHGAGRGVGGILQIQQSRERQLELPQKHSPEREDQHRRTAGQRRRRADSPTFSGSWSKCLPHSYLGIVNRAAWQSLVYALGTGRSRTSKTFR